MKLYANVYLDSCNRGFLDHTYHTAELAKKQKVKSSASGELNYAATIEINIKSVDGDRISYDLARAVLEHVAIPADTLSMHHLDEKFHRKFLQLMGWETGMTDSVIYKEKYLIQAIPYQLADTGEWVVKVNIVYDQGADTVFSPYTAHDSRFDSKDDAVAHCFQFGRQVVDNNFE